jgi:CheY-like chemotaxis protein
MHLERPAQGRVILVEDDVSLRAVLSFLLRSDGWDVEEAGDGRIGLRLTRRHGPSLVVTDLRMPEMGGLELACEIASAEDLASVPVIAITANGSGLREAAEVSGHFAAVLRKPLEPEAFLAAVREAVR